ncbi:MAG: endonuclease/exonuclease/phosphatase family protein [Sphingobacteriaceae bacterium]
MSLRNKKTKPSWLRKTLLILNICACVTLLISYAASFISPATFWLIAFAGLAYPFLLLFNVVFAVIWLFKKPVFSLLSLVTILIGWKFLVSTIGFREENAIQVPKSSNDILRVMTWNVHYFRKFEEQTGYDTAIKDQMMDIIRKEQPDILCIQEYSARRKGEFNFKNVITEILKSKHYYIEEAYGNDYEMNGYAIFSKFPIKNKGKVNFGDLPNGNDVIFADFEVKKQKFRVYNVHLQSINFQPEDYEYLKNVKKDINTDVNSTKRVSRRLKSAFIKRSEQVHILRDHAKSANKPYIIAGDFNDTPVSYAVNKLAKGMKNTFREKGSGFGITYNGDFPNFQIDYILTSPTFDVINYTIIDKKLSDHYAVRADLELKP